MTDRNHRLNGPAGRAITRPGAGGPIGDWQRLSAMYEAADGLDAAALQAQIAAWRQEGSPLLDQLLQMLAARERVQHSDFLGTPAALPELSVPADPGAVPACGWSAGSRIGPYRLLRHAGSGGMAEVWLAERADGAFNRQVAVKLLFQHADSTRRTSFAQRFARERDILASLHHPNIAALHDAGVTPDGQPWLALEYVEGEPITAWCDRAQLSISERVGLFRQVLLAVQHAHANLVIHRDIKPANILVTRAGEVRLLDFGIAKLQEAGGGALAETELTRHAGRPLTVQYASPEQLKGLPLTTACDVYGLGVVLYELLCGERPYELKTVSAAQMEQAILEAEPRAMSRRALTDAVAAARATTPKVLRKVLAPELDAVVLRMLAKRPADRYGSVESVLADVDRWGRGEPVLARVPSAAYRLRKFALRHPWGVGLGALASGSLVAVALLAVVMSIEARREAATSAAATQFLFEMFRRADPDNSQGIGPAAGLLLDKGRETVLRTLGTQPELQAELLYKIAEVQLARSEYPQADQSVEAAIRLHAAAGERGAEAKAWLLRAWVACYVGDLRLAEESLGKAEALRAGQDAAFIMRSAHVRGLIDRASGDLVKAQVNLGQAAALAAGAFGADDARSVEILSDLAIAEVQAKDFAGALSHIDESVQRLARKTDALPTDRITARNTQALIEQQAGHFEAARAHLHSLAADCIRWLDPGSEYCTQASQREAVVLLTIGRAAEALALLPMLERQADNQGSPARAAEAVLVACRIRFLNQPNATSLPSCERTRELGASSTGVPLSAALRLSAQLVTAEYLLHGGRLEEALTQLDRTESQLSAPAGALRRVAARLYALRGVTLARMDRFDDAIPALRRAVSEQSAATSGEHPTAMLMSAQLAAVLAAAGQMAEARALLDRADPIVEGAMGAGTPVVDKLRSLRDALRQDGPAGPSRIGAPDLFV
jgi:serine/threonine protein kinase/tetratricopeptide (TPR) repeat protein